MVVAIGGYVQPLDKLHIGVAASRCLARQKRKKSAIFGNGYGPYTRP